MSEPKPKFCALLTHERLVVFDTFEARAKAAAPLRFRNVPVQLVEIEIDIVEKAFAQERMIALVAAARALKANELRKEAAHYMQCAREERKRVLGLRP